MDDSEEWRDSDRARRRRSDVQGKADLTASELQLYSFLNRSAQSLSRSNSQSGRTHRVKDKELQASSDRDTPRASHAAPSRLPLVPNNASEASQGRYYSSARTSRSATGAAASVSTQPRKSSSPPLTPVLQHKYTVSSTPKPNPPTIAYSYNTPPQTPSSSRNYSNPSSPTSPTTGRGIPGADLFINRPLARPITPSNSTSRKVFGISLPSPNSRKATLEIEETPNRQTHKLRSGSGSSNEPLLHGRSPTNESERVERRPSTSTPGSTPRTNRTSEDRTPLPTPSSSLPRSHRSAASREEPPAFPATSSRRGTPKLDFWRSVTPHAPAAQGEREKEEGRLRAATHNVDRKAGPLEQPGLVSPQPRAPATFLPSVPQLQRTPPTPRKGEQCDTRASPRVDSFMSDSMPLPPSALKTPQGDDPSGLTRQPAFSQKVPPRTPRTPAPEHKPAPALGIQRSNSAPGTNTSRGRLSPCLRIPSPKFLNKERSREREKEKEKEMHREKRRVTPESVGAPMLREPRTHAHTHGHAGEKGMKAPKTSMVQLRRAAHGTFDFERPGSRTSSKSGQSESHGTRSDDEKEKEKENEIDGRRVPAGKPPRISEPIRSILKAPSPVPPLPTPRLKPRSPPPTRTRSPLAISPTATTHSHLHADDSALPRLSSSLARRNSSSNQHHRTHGHGHRTPASLPHFSFEPAAPAPPSAAKSPRDVGGQYIDTRTGLIMWAPTIPEDTPRRSEGGRWGTSSNGHTAIAPRELEEATAVITQFKSALDEAGFATLQKYVRRYDAQIIPLEGAAGLLTRVQRLLEMSAPRVDERRKRQLFDSFTRVVSQVR